VHLGACGRCCGAGIVLAGARGRVWGAADGSLALLLLAHGGRSWLRAARRRRVVLLRAAAHAPRVRLPALGLRVRLSSGGRWAGGLLLRLDGLGAVRRGSQRQRCRAVLPLLLWLLLLATLVAVVLVIVGGAVCFRLAGLHRLLVGCLRVVAAVRGVGLQAACCGGSLSLLRGIAALLGQAAAGVSLRGTKAGRRSHHPLSCSGARWAQQACRSAQRQGRHLRLRLRP
jgi:hypothetical protein